MCMSWNAYVTPLLHKLHWFPVYFQVQFKVLVTAYKDLLGIRPFSLREHLSPIVFAWLVQGVGTLWVPSVIQCYLSGLQMRAFCSCTCSLEPGFHPVSNGPYPIGMPKGPEDVALQPSLWWGWLSSLFFFFLSSILGLLSLSSLLLLLCWVWGFFLCLFVSFLCF